jgi:uncharacterized membrane protein YphA (DoxX/SURF4 family)
LSIWGTYLVVEERVSHFLKIRSITILEYLVAFIYIWYGLLKVFGVSPVEELVVSSTSWIFPREFVFFLGIWEFVIGLFLCFKSLRRYAIWLFIPQVLGTFLPLITNPEDCFVKFPYIPTLEGHYIFKNVVLIGAVLVIASTLYHKKSRPPPTS